MYVNQLIYVYTHAHTHVQAWFCARSRCMLKRTLTATHMHTQIHTRTWRGSKGDSSCIIYINYTIFLCFYWLDCVCLARHVFRRGDNCKGGGSFGISRIQARFAHARVLSLLYGMHLHAHTHSTHARAPRHAWTSVHARTPMHTHARTHHTRTHGLTIFLYTLKLHFILYLPILVLSFFAPTHTLARTHTCMTSCTTSCTYLQHTVTCFLLSFI